MKKSTKLMVALLVIVAALAVTYRLMNRVPSADLEANAQMQQIITDAGCFEMSHLKPRFAVLCQYARGRKDCDGGREQGLSCF